MTRQNVNFRAIRLLFPLLLIAGTARAQSGPVAAYDFGMQCGQASGECPAPITLPTVPGLLRLWDSQIFWSSINDQHGGPYKWSMVKPAAGIIDTNVPGAKILTPSVCDNRDPNSCKASVDFETWLQGSL